ncbi:MAG: hypothetical protein NT059_12420 [Planctomycetota bacterium]|nr:hypothetical protein [Planctomycetota bacterium]
MSLLIATLAIGLVFAVLALGIYMSFRVYQMPDITADGSFPLGAAITARLLRDGADPVTATLAGMAAHHGREQCAHQCAHALHPV